MYLHVLFDVVIAVKVLIQLFNILRITSDVCWAFILLPGFTHPNLFCYVFSSFGSESTHLTYFSSICLCEILIKSIEENLR